MRFGARSETSRDNIPDRGAWELAGCSISLRSPPEQHFDGATKLQKLLAELADFGFLCVDFRVQPLNGGECHAIGVHHCDGVLIRAESKRSTEVL